MNNRSSSMISAVVTLFIFTIIPLLAPNYLPHQYLDYAARIGIDVFSFANQLAIMGIAVAILTLLKGFVAPSSPIYLITVLVSSGLTFAFTLVTVSLGRIEELGSLGLTTMSVEVQGSINAIVLDFRFLLQLAALSVILRMIEAVFAFIEAKKESSVAKTLPLIQLK